MRMGEFSGVETCWSCIFRSYCFTNSVNYKIFGGIWFIRKVTKLATELFCVVVVANLNQIIIDMIYSTLNKISLRCTTTSEVDEFVF